MLKHCKVSCGKCSQGMLYPMSYSYLKLANSVPKQLHSQGFSSSLPLQGTVILILEVRIMQKHVHYWLSKMGGYAFLWLQIFIIIIINECNSLLLHIISQFHNHAQNSQLCLVCGLSVLKTADSLNNLVMI